MSYYHEHALEYIDNTKDCNMFHLYFDFEKHLKPGDKILDVGFGSGRDSLYFSKKYLVTSIDPEITFCEHAKSIGLKNVKNIKAQEINFENEFNGIWACASLLHIPSEELPLVFKKCFDALKINGVLYASFKMSDFEGMRNGRYFTDLTVEKFLTLIKETEFKIDKISFTDDVRKERTDKWINVYLVK